MSKIKITLDKEQFLTENNLALLEHLEACGVKVRGCRKGICGRCRVKLLVGEVCSQLTSGLLPHEREQGWILLCQSTLKEDIEITLN